MQCVGALCELPTMRVSAAGAVASFVYFLDGGDLQVAAAAGASYLALGGFAVWRHRGA